MILELELQNPAAAPIAEAQLECWVRAALGERCEDAELVVRIVDEAEGRVLNHRWRGIDRATNVLSFPADLPPGLTLPLLGDIVLCAPVVAREAVEQRKALTDHYAHLVVHGVLHLLGHDHQQDEEAERMEGIETQVLADLGIADPYRTHED